MMTKRELESGIRKLQKRVDELEAFDWKNMSVNHPPELDALGQSIDRSLSQIFGEDSSDYNRFSGAASLQYYQMFYTSDEPTTPLWKYRELAGEKIDSAIVIIKGAIASLEEDLEEVEDSSNTDNPLINKQQMKEASSLSNNAKNPYIKNKKIFIVHGHDDAALQKVARFLDNLNLEPIILREQANAGKTIIEKIESNSDVNFAVVLLTPDDFGGLEGEDSKPRARQNVILELGYFFGKLGRHNVCVLRKGEVDIPNDFAGVVWTSLDDDDGWKLVLCRELKAARYDIDLNKVF